MNINRHNYETFFLLYVDNELSAAERKTVEVFVQENADLQMEFQSFKDTTLAIEPVSFDSLESLYKNEIELDALQQQLLLHLDNELDPASKNEIAARIQSDHAVKKEWQVWEQTKLDNKEKIEYTDKKLLYRYENTRVVSIRFWRVAAAAAILLVGLFTGISVLRNNHPVTTDVAKKEAHNKVDLKPGVDTIKRLPGDVNNNLANISTTDDAAGKKEVNVNRTKIKTDNTSNVDHENIAASEPARKNKTQVAKTSLENINKQSSNEINASTVLNNKRDEVPVQNKIPVDIANKPVTEKIHAPSNPVIDYNSVPAMPDSYARTAVFNEGASENNNKILYMKEETVSRSKAGGLFRKVKRMVERNTNISTGNGIKIAGYEIAIR